MILSYPALLELVRSGVIEHAREKNVKAASIDVRLGNKFYAEGHYVSSDPVPRAVNLIEETGPPMNRFELAADEPFLVAPKEFVLAETAERFNLPDSLAAEFRLRSSLARAGLDQALAIWCDPGWHGSVLTLELINNLNRHSLMLFPGMAIGQMIFHSVEGVPAKQSYAANGRYNNDSTVQQSRGV